MTCVAISYAKENNTMLAMVLTYVPTIVYSMVILVVNVYYRHLAKMLNDWGECARVGGSVGGGDN